MYVTLLCMLLLCGLDILDSRVVGTFNALGHGINLMKLDKEIYLTAAFNCCVSFMFDFDASVYSFCIATDSGTVL